MLLLSTMNMNPTRLRLRQCQPGKPGCPQKSKLLIILYQVSRLLLPSPGANAIPTPIATFLFDTNQELLWVGNEYGRVSSFYGSELQRYTSFKAGDGPVRQLLVHDKGIIALCSRSIHMSMRRGPPLWHIT